METQTTTEPGKKLKETDFHRITPFLWFDNQAADAVNFYTTIFNNGKIKTITRYGEKGAEAAGRQKGSVMTIAFQIEGQEFVAINGGPVFAITPAISFFVNCDTAIEIDKLWKNLSLGGTVLMELSKYPFSEKFGWIRDKYGVTWQLNLAKASQKIATFLLFAGKQHGKAEEAMNFYVSIFKNSGVSFIQRFGAGDMGAEGTVQHARFSLESQEFIAMDSNREHQFSFTPGLSLVVNCKDQQEIDYYWEILSKGGDARAQQCGWLEDKYGISWQITPSEIGEMLSDTNPGRSERVMNAVLQMKKIDLQTLKNAYEQRL